jgi:hypothetical protein
MFPGKLPFSMPGYTIQHYYFKLAHGIVKANNRFMIHGAIVL